MSFIYSDIIQTHGKKIARKCGYFNTGKDFELLVPYYSDIYDSLFDTLWKYFEKPIINNLTTFMYYPYKDTAERMSLPVFDQKMHKHFQQFLKEVQNL